MATDDLPQTGGGGTFHDFLKVFKEVCKEKESVETLLQDSENMEKVAGTLILMCNSDSGPVSDSFIEQLQKEACEDREKAMRQVQQYT